MTQITLNVKPCEGAYFVVPISTNECKLIYSRKDIDGYIDGLDFIQKLFEKVNDFIPQRESYNGYEIVEISEDYEWPRGTITLVYDTWHISEINTPQIIKHQILAKFGLLEENRIGKVKWDKLEKVI